MVKKSNGTELELAQIPRSIITVDKSTGKELSYVQFSAVMNVEGMTMSDDDQALPIPRLKVLQGLSREVSNAVEGAKPGVFWHTAKEAACGEEIQFLPLVRYKDRFFFSDPGRQLICMSRDGAGKYGLPMSGDEDYSFSLQAITTKIGDTEMMVQGCLCQTCRYSQWRGSGKDRKPPLCDANNMYIGMLKDEFEEICTNVEHYASDADVSDLFGKFCVMDFKRTSFQIGEELRNKIMMQGGIAFKSVITIKIKKDQGTKGAWFGPQLVRSEVLSNAQLIVARGLSRFAQQMRPQILVSYTEALKDEYVEGHTSQVISEQTTAPQI